MKKLMLLLTIIMLLLSASCTADDPAYVETLRSNLGYEGNAWNNEMTGTEGLSNIIDVETYPYISIFGKVSDNTTIALYVSADGTNFYFSENLTTTAPPGAAGYPYHFSSFKTVGARYLILRSEGDVLATATIVAKQ